MKTLKGLRGLKVVKAIKVFPKIIQHAVIHH